MITQLRRWHHRHRLTPDATTSQLFITSRVCYPCVCMWNARIAHTPGESNPHIVNLPEPTLPVAGSLQTFRPC